MPTNEADDAIRLPSSQRSDRSPGEPSEFDPPVSVRPLNARERGSRAVYEACTADDDPVPPLGGSYDGSRMGRR